MSRSVNSTDLHRAGTSPRSAVAAYLTTYTAQVIGLTVAALVLRLLFLGSHSLWVDEGATADVVTATWPRLEALVTSSFASLMAFYYVIVHEWISLAGASVFSLRLPSAIFSTLTIPVLYALGAELFDRRTGALAAALMTVNVTAIGFGQDARAYSLLLLLVTLSALFFVRAVRWPSTTNCAGYVVFGALSVYAHLFGILVLPAQWLSLWLFKPGRKALIRLRASATVFGLLTIPAFAIAIEHDSGVTHWIPPTTLSSVSNFFLFATGRFDLVHFQGYWRPYLMTGSLLALVYAAATIAAVGFAASGSRYRNQLWFAALCACVPIGITIVVSLVKPLFVNRYLLESQPFIVILAAAGIVLLADVIPRRAIVAVVSGIILVGLCEDYIYYQSYSWENWRDAVSYVAARERPGDAMVICRTDARWGVDYYIDRLKDPAKFPVIVYPNWNGMFRLGGHFIDGRTFNAPDPYLRKALAARYPRVWLVVREHQWSTLHNIPAAGMAWQRLSSRYGPPEARKFYGVEVALFASPGESAQVLAAEPRDISRSRFPIRRRSGTK